VHTDYFKRLIRQRDEIVPGLGHYVFVELDEVVEHLLTARNSADARTILLTCYIKQFKSVRINPGTQ